MSLPGPDHGPGGITAWVAWLVYLPLWWLPWRMRARREAREEEFRYWGNYHALRESLRAGPPAAGAWPMPPPRPPDCEHPSERWQ